MGGNASFPMAESIDPSSLTEQENINSNALFSMRTCLSINPQFKGVVLLQYQQTVGSSFPDKISQSTTLKSITNCDFKYEKLLERACFVKHLNHPSIVRVFSSIIEPKLSSLFLICEPILPCNDILPSIGRDELLSGFYSILQALDFLHSRVNISHNYIEVQSIFLNAKRKWKLCAFEFSSPLHELSSNKLEVIEYLKGRGTKREAFKLHKNYNHCYDIYCFSRMVIEILPRLQIEADDLNNVLLRSGIHESPEQRLSADKLLEHSVFKSPYSHVFSFLSDYVLKPDSQKISFFEEFPNLSVKIPEELLCISVIPLLLSPLIFTDFPSKNVVNLLLSPGQSGLISEDAFTRLVAPQIIHSFRSHELTTRLILLKNFSSYAYLLGKASLIAIILPEVCLGVFDSSDLLASSSLSAISHLSYLLGIQLVLSHMMSLSDAMRKKGLLDCCSNAPAGRLGEVFNHLSVGTSRAKPLIYSAASHPWRRTSVSIFPDAAPKVGGLAREPHATVPTKSSTKRLLDMATLSATYVPPDPVLPKPKLPPVTKLSSSKTKPQRTISSSKSSQEFKNSQSPNLNGKQDGNSFLRIVNSSLQTPLTSPSAISNDPSKSLTCGDAEQVKMNKNWEDNNVTALVVDDANLQQNGSTIPSSQIANYDESLVETMKKLSLQQMQVDELVTSLEPNINFASQSLFSNSRVSQSTSGSMQRQPMPESPLAGVRSAPVKLSSDGRNLQYQPETDDHSDDWDADWADDSDF